jgi:hypothetical protein
VCFAFNALVSAASNVVLNLANAAMAPISLPTYPSNVIAVLMRNGAREAVKYNIRAEGLRVTDFLPKDISRMAEAFPSRQAPRWGAALQ